MLLALLGPKRGCPQAEISCFQNRPGSLAGALAGLLVLFGAQCGCSQAETNFFVFPPSQPWISGYASVPVGHRRRCAQAEMSCFKTDLDLWLCSWLCLDPKGAVPKQKQAVFRTVAGPLAGPGWAPGPVRSPKWLFSSRNDSGAPGRVWSLK